MAPTDTPPGDRPSDLAALANAALGLWDVPADASARLINLSENATYIVEGPHGYRSVLRVHRDGYHDRRAIESELAWARALNQAGVIQTPVPIPGRDGSAIQQASHPALPGPRWMVMFHFIDGAQPDENQDLTHAFGQLGDIAARTHDHVLGWCLPATFQRPSWDVAAVFGPGATWGDWRAAPNVTPPLAAVLERVEATVCARLLAFGTQSDRYGLIHADMRLANLLIHDGDIRLIDFDDCGAGWFLYDFAAAISFMEDHPQVPALRAAWVAGYRARRPLSDTHEAEIDTFVMLRRLALLAWVGSHAEAPEPQALAPDFARVSAELGEAYLTRMG